MDGAAAASSSSSSSSSAALREETERLVGDYLEHRVAGLGLGLLGTTLGPAALGGSASSSSSRAAETLRRVAGELERRERPFFRRACAAALAEEEEEEAAASGDAAAPSGLSGGACRCLARVAAQMDAEGGLNWGRVAALVAFAGSLAAARAEQRRAAGEGEEAEAALAETRRALAHALAAYLAGEKRHWLQAHGGWEGKSQPLSHDGGALQAESVLVAVKVMLEEAHLDIDVCPIPNNSVVL